MGTPCWLQLQLQLQIQILPRPGAGERMGTPCWTGIPSSSEGRGGIPGRETPPPHQRHQIQIRIQPPHQRPRGGNFQGARGGGTEAAGPSP